MCTKIYIEMKFDSFDDQSETKKLNEIETDKSVGL